MDKKTFYIFDHFLLPTPYNHRFFVEKFARGFEYHGYDVKIAHKISDIKNDGFVMISNHDWCFSLGKRALKRSLLRSAMVRIYRLLKFVKKLSFLSQVFIIKKLCRYVENRNVVVIAWFWNEYEDLFTDTKAKVIFTGEYFYGEPVVDTHKKWKQFYSSKKYALPIRFSADINPLKVGEGCENSRYCVSYVGNKTYKPHYYNLFVSMPNSKIIPTPPYISEQERISIYKDSMVSLGLHSNVNIDNKVVVERIFEALAYGAICVTDNPYAVSATDNCAVFVKNADECFKTVIHFCNNEKDRKLLRQKGFDFISKKGTYAHRASEFISLASELYRLN